MAFHAAHARLVEGRARAQPGWRVDPASDRNISTRAERGEAERECLACGHRDALPHRYRLAVEGRLHIRAADGEHHGGIEFERGANELAFEPSRSARITPH